MRRLALVIGVAVVALSVLGVSSAAKPGPLRPGTLDPGFGEGGVALVPSLFYAAAVALQPDRKILVGGTNGLARFKPNGSLDSSFGNGGVAPTDFPAEAVAVDVDGTIVIAGDGGTDGFVLARFTQEGYPDETFGTYGEVRTPIGASGGASGLAIRLNGKIVAAGSASDGTRDEVALVQYNEDGSLDRTFGNGGIVLTDAAAPEGKNVSYAFAIVLQRNGKAVVAGGTDCTDGHCGCSAVVLRYLRNGSLDPTFGADGEVNADFPSCSNAFAVAVAPSGKIVVGGASHGFALARLNPDGSPDKDFGKDGLVIDSPAVGDLVAGVAVTADGKVVAAGVVRLGGGDYQLGLARYKSDGQLDKSFGRRGVVVTRIPQWKTGGADALVVQRDGGIDVVGWLQGEDTFQVAGFVARYLGERPCLVPRVKGSTARVARRRIKDASCSLGHVARVFSSGVMKGRVVSQRPRAGHRLKAGAKVSLVVSKGRRPH